VDNPTERRKDMIDNTQKTAEEKDASAATETPKPKQFYDLRATIKKLLHVLVEDEILMCQVDRVLEGLREAIYTSTAVQERWANFDYNGNGYKDLPLK